jgi:hypothetical protein
MRMSRPAGIRWLAAIKETGSDAPAQPGECWLAGVYEVNALGEAWAGFDVLATGTMRFASKPDACSALGVSFDGDTLITGDPRAAARARRLCRPDLINSRHAPGQLAAFVHRAPHLTGSGLMTFAASDSLRSITAMAQELLPARDAAEARTRLLAAVDGAKAVPERDEAEQFLEHYLGVPPGSPAPAAARAAMALETLTDDFRGYWSTWVGNTRIGLLHADCWAARTARRPAWLRVPRLRGRGGAGQRDGRA